MIWIWSDLTGFWFFFFYFFFTVDLDLIFEYDKNTRICQIQFFFSNPEHWIRHSQTLSLLDERCWRIDTSAADIPPSFSSSVMNDYDQLDDLYESFMTSGRSRFSRPTLTGQTMEICRRSINHWEENQESPPRSPTTLDFTNRFSHIVFLLVCHISPSATHLYWKRNCVARRQSFQKLEK